MRRRWRTWALLGFAVGTCWEIPARSQDAGTLPLTECRLEHPLNLTSVPARCGRLRVLEDRTNPKGNSVDLNLAIVPALNRRSTAAPLFLLAGGPGQSAMQMYVSLSGAFARINRDHAIVLLDQRGTGSSNLQSCEYPEDWQQPADPMPALRKATTDCLNKLGPRVSLYTTSIAVQDLDEVRAALGFEQIDLYAASYGTRVAELYMRRFPARVHAAILDGVTYPEQVIGVDTPLDGERSLNLIIARCQQSRDCAATYPELQQDLGALLKQFGPQKVQVTVDDPNSGLPMQFEFNHKILAAALRFLSYSAMQASLLPALIHEAAHGKLRPLASQAIMNTRQIRDQLANGMQFSVICSEDEPLFAGAKFDRAAVAKTYQGSDLVDSLHEICKLWPRGPVDADLHSALHSDIPTLLLSGEADPVTPPADAERAAAGLTRHRHLILKGEGHGQLATGCMPRLMAEFLEAVAPDKLEVSCLDQHTPEPFFLSMTGPAP